MDLIYGLTPWRVKMMVDLVIRVFGRWWSGGDFSLVKCGEEWEQVY